MHKSALIVVDLQYDFLPGGPISTFDKGIISVIRGLVENPKFDLTVASQDWHPQVIPACPVGGWCV